MKQVMECYNTMDGHTINELCPDMAQSMYQASESPWFDWWDTTYEDFSNNPGYYDVKVHEYWEANSDVIKNPDSSEAKEYHRLQEQGEGIVLSLECDGFDLGRGREISYTIGLDLMKWYNVYTPATEDGIAKMIAEKAMVDHYWHKRSFAYPNCIGDRECIYDWFGVGKDVDDYMQDVLGMAKGTDDYDEVYDDVDQAVMKYCEQIDYALEAYMKSVADQMLDTLEKEYEWQTSFECWLDGEYTIDDNICEQFGFLNELEEI